MSNYQDGNHSTKVLFSAIPIFSTWIAQIQISPLKQNTKQLNNNYWLHENFDMHGICKYKIKHNKEGQREVDLLIKILSSSFSQRIVG